MIECKLFKQGGSTTLVIPAIYLKALKWAVGDMIKVKLIPGGKILLSKGPEFPYKRSDLLEMEYLNQKEKENESNAHAN